MQRPNQLDLMIYRLFRWWWNPIFVKDPALARNIAIQFNSWIAMYERSQRKLKEKEYEHDPKI